MPQTVRETKHSVEKGWLKTNEMRGNVPIFDMWRAFRHHEI